MKPLVEGMRVVVVASELRSDTVY